MSASCCDLVRVRECSHGNVRFHAVETKNARAKIKKEMQINVMLGGTAYTRMFIKCLRNELVSNVNSICRWFVIALYRKTLSM